MPTPLTVTPSYHDGTSWVTVPVYAEDGPITITRGYTDEGTIRASQMTMRINDAAAPSLNPARAVSPIYGKTRAIPMRAIVQGLLVNWAETAGMDPDQSADYSEAPARGKRWIDVDSYGPLYRVNSWADPVSSPMTRTFAQYASLTGFWPGEDPLLSTLRGLGRTAQDVTTADDSAPPGASGSFVTTASSRCVFSPNSASSSAGFQVFWSMRMGAGPPASALPVFQWRANSLLWSIEPDTGGTHLKAYASGVVVSDFYIGLIIPAATWVSYRAKCYQSGGNVVCEFAWYQTSTGVLGITQSFAGTIDRLTSIRIEGTASTAGNRYTQIGSLSGVADDLQSAAAIASFEGYSGETTVDRFKRLLTEAGVSWYVIGASTTRMGPQKADKLIDLIKEIAATEDGLVFDGRGILAICLRTRRSRTNQASALDLVLADHVVPPMKERLDNVGVTNQIILEDRSGAVAVAERTTGPMSTAAYPAGIGVYKGGAQPDVNVNLYDPGELQNAANWYLARGTVPGARWPSVTVEVGLKSPTIQTAACTVEIGDRITVTGRTPDVLELQVIGYTMTVGTHTLTITYVCIPGDMFLLGAEDSTTYVLDAYASTIITAPAPATTGTSMVVGSPDPDDVWSTTSLPYPIVVAGERMTVTAATAPALTAGTWRQTLTVTRSVNGVVKAQVVGAPVHVFYPIREAW